MRSRTSTTQVESDRIGEAGKASTAETAQRNQRHRSRQTLPERPEQQRKPRKQDRIQPPEHREPRPNRKHATTHPAPRSPEVQRIRTKLPSRRADAVALRKQHDLFRLRKGSRKTRTKTVRQGAERHPAVSAVPARNPHPDRLLAAIRSVLPLTATRIKTNKTVRRTCLTPGLPDNVRFGGQLALVAKLQWPSTARRASIARADPLFQYTHSTTGNACPGPTHTTTQTHPPARNHPPRNQPAGKESTCNRTALLPDHCNP